MQHNGPEPQHSPRYPKLSVALSMAALAYLIALILSFKGQWFNPHSTGGDATQQLFPFYQAIAPDIFKDDIIFESMKSYLAPLHWWIGYGTTLLTHDPVMTGHWIMLYQFLTVSLFLFLTVQYLASTPAALLALIWFMHQEQLIGNIATGLPRGWIGAILIAFLYFLVQKKHAQIWIVLFVGSLLNAVGTFVAAICYGSFMVLGITKAESRPNFKKPFILACILAPLLLVTTMMALSRPNGIGKMVTLAEASKMEAFQRKGGRFPFLPFLSVQQEFQKNAFRSFVSKKAKMPRNFRLILIGGVVLLLAVFAIIGRVTRREILQREVLLLIGSATAAYLLARVLAFNLYVPARYLNWPFGMAWTVLFPVALWRSHEALRRNKFGKLLVSVIAISALAIVLAGTGFRVGKRGALATLDLSRKPAPPYAWIKAAAPRTAVLASHPVYINALPLAGMRRAYITEETAHPFYDQYWAEAQKRISVSLKAFYAEDLSDLKSAVAKERIDYFIFPRSYFELGSDGSGLSHRSIFKPFLTLSRELTARTPEAYLGWRLLNQSQGQDPDFIVYRDSECVVVDLNRLN